MSPRERLWGQFAEAGGRLRVRSAVNPMLWLCAIVTMPCVALATLVDDSLSWLVYVAVAPVVAAIGSYAFLLLFDRDKLQSEDYQIRKLALNIIQEKHDALESDPDSTVEALNAASSEATGGEGGGQ